MRKLPLHAPEGDIFVSSDIYQEYESTGNDELAAWSVTEAVMGLLGTLDALEREYALLYAKSIRKPRIACLMAHGGGPGWSYVDGETEGLVQDWIHEHDRRYGLLMIYSCNPAGETPKARGSLLLIPDRSFSHLSITMGQAHLSLVHPTLGELDPVIDYELKRLKLKGAPP